ncbi:MAG TPA: phosphoethanolamine--lipid A transferase [Burkholderiaceae bacterium]|nr:phosphoethanolamine--lipid A transferase [Burkholderiaceae bacterium]
MNAIVSGVRPGRVLARWRPVVSAESLILVVAVFIAIADNVPFWRGVLLYRDFAAASTWSLAVLTLLLLTAVHYVVLASLSTRRTLKPVLCVSMLIAAVVAHYISRYGIVIDTSMMRNVLQTDALEARELVGVDLAATLLPLAALPIALVAFTRVAAPRRHAFTFRSATIAVAAISAVVVALLGFKDFAPTLRNHPEIRNMLTPANLLVSTARAVRQQATNVTEAREGPMTVSRGAAALATANERPVLFVFVVGETARAANFSLNGYARETNPELAKLDVINFPHARACGTSTEVSLPCMFSPFGRRSYDEAKILRRESLPQQLARAGIRVVWRDNQSGCKGVCTGVEVHTFNDANAPDLCVSGHCFDEVLLHGMDALVRESRSDLFVVLHQIGNHGPAYYRRYPSEFARFEPACQTDTLHQCTQQQIVNAYDNSLRYTDHVLARVIAFLEQQRGRYDVAMVYVSDHGESLGERGLYLHGMPYAIAPKEQLEVPMLWWMSPEFVSHRNIDVACLRQRAREPVSHDYLFHSIAGLLDVETPDRDRALDLFANCRHEPAQRSAAFARNPQ